VSAANNAHIVAVLGASGSGKSAYLKRTIAKGSPRLLIFDPMAEYDGEIVSDLAGLVAGLKAKRFRLVFRPKSDDKLRAVQFDFLCRAALAAGNLTLVVEELRFVTTPSRAPMGWAKVCLTGRHKGLKVYGASQRPASIDKDFLGNCTIIRAGRLAYPEDIRAVSKATGTPPDQLAALRPLDWIEKNMTNGKITRGTLTFP
jgi:DNA helicase HerA-like ATPase